jgi:S1-C subfamily serine protease
MKILAGALFLFLISPAARAQDKQDEERVKRIVERIEKEIRESHERTREEIRAIIRAEIQRSGGKPVEPSAPARKVYLGITAGDLSDEERKAHGGGIKIAEVRGPAKDAGLVPGDFLTEIDQREVSEDNIGELLSKRQPGDTVELTIIRGKKSRHVKVVLGERKD